MVRSHRPLDRSQFFLQNKFKKCDSRLREAIAKGSDPREGKMLEGGGVKPRVILKSEYYYEFDLV